MPDSNSLPRRQGSIVSIATDWLYEEWAQIDQSYGLDPGRLAQDAIDVVINALRRNPQWHSIRRNSLDLLLADARQEIERNLSEILRDYLPADQMLDCAKNVVGEVLVEIRKRKKQ